jgi:hypothetical protein
MLVVVDARTNSFFHLVNFPRKHVEIFVGFTFFPWGFDFDCEVKMVFFFPFDIYIFFQFCTAWISAYVFRSRL